MLKNYKKANKKEVEVIKMVSLNSVVGGCTWENLCAEFEKLNNLKIELIKNNWLCCNNGKKYKIFKSYIMNYEGVLIV